MNELVIISGKGGTGKTSLTASFAALARDAVLADCDVDAADLHLILNPEIVRREDFFGGHGAAIRAADCIPCGICHARCRYNAIHKGSGAPAVYTVDPLACEGCGVCVWSCPVKAIDFPKRRNGEWYVSNTRFGPMAHARLDPGGENSGRLVSRVRELARELATEHKREQIIVDGPPGVGCAVIASLSGATRVLVVTEPTLSGAHDLARVLQLARHFNVPAAVCVNKWDLNPEMTERIEAEAPRAGAVPVGRVRYDAGVTTAQRQGLAVVEVDEGPLAADIRAVWERLHS